MKIIIDSREQKPLWLKSTKKIEVETKTLKTGDYSIEGYEDRFSIERKSISDLFKTLGAGNKRFKKEIARGLEMDYFAIIVDGSYDRVLNKDFDGSFFTKMKGHVITSILFTIHVKYKVPIFFTESRSQSKRVIKELMKAFLKQQPKVSETPESE